MAINPKGTLRYRITALLGKSFIRSVELAMAPFLGSRQVFGAREFPWASMLEQGCNEVAGEYARYTAETAMPDICDISEEQYSVVQRGEWDFLPLYVYGIPIKENLSRMPKTAKLLDTVPDKTTVFFSVLKPGTSVKAHRGAFRGYLRYHLGVSVPEPDACALRIGSEEYRWAEGKSLIFDDTFIHEAWNKGTKERVILYVDFIRPMPPLFRVLTRWITYLISRSPFVQNGLEKLKWAGKAGSAQ